MIGTDVSGSCVNALLCACLALSDTSGNALGMLRCMIRFSSLLSWTHLGISRHKSYHNCHTMLFFLPSFQSRSLQMLQASFVFLVEMLYALFFLLCFQWQFQGRLSEISHSSNPSIFVLCVQWQSQERIRKISHSSNLSLSVHSFFHYVGFLRNLGKISGTQPILNMCSSTSAAFCENLTGVSRPRAHT